jgi:hypothetical protein
MASSSLLLASTLSRSAPTLGTAIRISTCRTGSCRRCPGSKGLHLMRSLAGALERIGASGIRLRGAPGHRPAARPMRAPNAEGDAERIRQALERIGNSNTHYDDWIRIGHAIKAALPGAGGQELWCWWSSLSGKDRPEITRRKWATFDPRTISAGTIFHLAREGAR